MLKDSKNKDISIFGSSELMIKGVAYIHTLLGMAKKEELLTTLFWLNNFDIKKNKMIC